MSEKCINYRKFRKIHTYCDANQPTNTINNSLYVLTGSIIRSKAKILKEALNNLVLQVLARDNIGDLLEHQDETLVHLIQVQEGSNPTLFGL